MFIELHAPDGTRAYHNVDRICVVGTSTNGRTVINYETDEYVVQETAASVMGLIKQIGGIKDDVDA